MRVFILARLSPRLGDHERYPPIMSKSSYPTVENKELVGTYDALAHAGGGYTWDAVLEYRVWMHPEHGAPDECDGDDYYYAFESYEDALEFAETQQGAEEPLALILQKEHINEPKPGLFEHITVERVTEWPVEFLTRPRRTENTIPDFFSPNAPENRLDIIRGLD